MRLDHATVHLLIEGPTDPDVTITADRVVIHISGEVALDLEGSRDAVEAWLVAHLVALTESTHVCEAS